MLYKAVVIGASSGGMNALKTILPVLPEGFTMPIIIVQHIGAASGNYWIEMLNNLCKLYVKEADEKEKVQQGYVYIAPPNYHLLLEQDETLSLSTDKRVNFARPSIDVLFESAADVYKERLVGVILSGSNSDGTEGVRKIKKYGGLVIAQDPETAESAFMPASAIEQSAVDHISSLESIAEILMAINKPS